MWAVVFDLDGVLVDTAKLHAEAWRRLAEELGISLSEEFLRSLRGLNRMDSLDRILEWGGRTEVGTAERERLAEQKNLWYVGSLEHLTPRDVLPGVVELLDGLATSPSLLLLFGRFKELSAFFQEGKLSPQEGIRRGFCFDRITSFRRLSDTPPRHRSERVPLGRSGGRDARLPWAYTSRA
ncbi:MAG: HAD hydrolase-like protein [Brockia lithotrophica]|nr:HAD hydrolase-like protein [Brockia lithotrophica]